jgi:hypothetical protein
MVSSSLILKYRPWEFERILANVLTRGVHRQSPVQVLWTESSPARILESSPGSGGRIGMFKELWSIAHSQGDVERIVRDAMVEIDAGAFKGELILMKQEVKKLKKR